MELTNSVWQLGVIALLAGAMIGILAYRLLSSSEKEADKIKGELDAARKELSDYKTSVNQHFDKTSELVNDLTQNYVKVYQHLAEGAQTLGDSRTFTNLLEQHQGRVSIAVDEETEASRQEADDSIVDAAVASAASVETLDEHAELFNDVTTAEINPVSVEEETDKKEEASKSTAESESAVEDKEPVVNVDALDKAVEKADTKVEADAGVAVPEVEEKDEVRATRH